jgi:hypothetical protein
VSDYPQVWENEDGEGWAPVEQYPDFAAVAQQYADSTGMVVESDGQETIDAQDCECETPGESCPDDADGKPCRVYKGALCWHFYTGQEPSDFDDGAELYFPHDKAGRTLVLGHVYCRDGFWKKDGCQEHRECWATEQEHYRERIEAPGQTVAFAPSPETEETK